MKYEKHEFDELFSWYNKTTGFKAQYYAGSRVALMEQVLDRMSKAEVENYIKNKVGENPKLWIDDVLKEIIKTYGVKTVEPVQQELIKPTESTETKEEIKMEKSVGNELQNLLLETIAKYSADKMVENLMPMIEQKVINEFGMKPIQHEIKIGTAEPVKLKAELPPVFDEILGYAVAGNNVMMTGPAGTGKGFMARQVAKACGAKFFEVNAVRNDYELKGFVDANSRFVRSPFYDACKASAEGEKVVFLFDEMDCSDEECLKVFNEALEAREFTFPNDEKLEFEDMIILCACNTFGTGADELYCGRQLDASTLNRFMVVRVDYNRKIEMAIARGDEELVDFIDSFRSQTEKNGLAFVVSYRNIKQIVNMKGSSIPLKKVMKAGLVKSMSDDDLKNILNNLAGDFSENIYFKACKGENVKWELEQKVA